MHLKITNATNIIKNSSILTGQEVRFSKLTEYTLQNTIYADSNNNISQNTKRNLSTNPSSFQIVDVKSFDRILQVAIVFLTLHL